MLHCCWCEVSGNDDDEIQHDLVFGELNRHISRHSEPHVIVSCVGVWVLDNSWVSLALRGLRWL